MSLYIIKSIQPRSLHSSNNGSFPPTETDSDSDSDSKPYRYIVLCTTSDSTGLDSDSDLCTQIVSQMVTVPILGMDLHPRDPNPNPSPSVEMSHNLGSTKSTA